MKQFIEAEIETVTLRGDVIATSTLVNIPDGYEYWGTLAEYQEWLAENGEEPERIIESGKVYVKK